MKKIREYNELAAAPIINAWECHGWLVSVFDPLGRLEAYVCCRPTLDTSEKLADVLEVEPQELLKRQ